MYEAWRILKRNPFIYNPRAFAYLFVGYVFLGVYRQVTADYIFNFEHYEEDHPHCQKEALRQYARNKNVEFRNYVLEARAKQDKQLRIEAGLAADE